VPESPFAVSAILLSHNCADLIAAALHSVLGQEGEPMEIIVSDDASEDDTCAVLQRAVADYTGPHRVALRRREANSGSKSAHLNDVFPLASGRVLVSFDGDDISAPDRVRKIMAVFRRHPNVSAVYSNYALMDEGGRVTGRGRVRHPPPGTDARRWFARVDAYASGATLAVRRDVVEAFGALDPSIHEDVVLPFRASLLGEVRFLDEDLVRVRRWRGSLTADLERFISVERYRARMLRGIAQARRQLDSRLDDLRRAERLDGARQADLDELRRIALASLRDAEATAELVSPSPVTRLRCLARLVRSGAYREDLPQHAFLSLAPGLYMRYKRRRL
jgi:glycosyltransferase involved in cell wall biosynthesis